MRRVVCNNKNKITVKANLFFIDVIIFGCYGVIQTNWQCDMYSPGNKSHSVDMAHNLFWWLLVGCHFEEGHCKVLHVVIRACLLGKEQWVTIKRVESYCNSRDSLWTPFAGPNPMGLWGWVCRTQNFTASFYMCVCNASKCRIMLPRRL